jgi:predicted nucleic acid-binding protein
VARPDSSTELAKVISWLVDTGPLVAYLDASDRAHARVAASLEGFTGELCTTSAVITEAMHFLAAESGGPRLLADLISAASVRIYDLAQAPELRAAVVLMERYADTPMDYADATLVLLAGAIGVADILTLDRRGFASYLIGPRKGFRLVLDG